MILRNNDGHQWGNQSSVSSQLVIVDLAYNGATNIPFDYLADVFRGARFRRT